MSTVNLKRFVDINIRSNVPSQVVGTRDTIVLFTATGTKGNVKTIASMSEANQAYTDATTLAYLKMFFDNGGAKVQVIEGMSYTAITVDDIKALDNDLILIAFAYAEVNIVAAYAAIKSLATQMNADQSVYGINEKILLARTKTETDTDLVKNFAVKYSTVLGAEMTIGAYLSQIDVYEQADVYDYAFTVESITAEAVTDTLFGTLMTNNYNVDVKLANAVRNLGGNCKNGEDLTNDYVRIILHQTLTDRLIQLLAQKLKNTTGLAQIYTVICQELEQYRSSGYLTNDKIWTKPDLIISYNQQEYRVIEKGTALTNGYIVKVLPVASLSDADKAARKTPPIYVILADQYGIRQITINGEVI